MPAPAVALKLRNFRRRFGIAAPRVTIRSHIGWQWYAMACFALVAVVASVAWSLAQRGEVSLLDQDVRNLQKQLANKDEELVRLRAGAATGQNAVQMERSAQQQLLSRLNVLEQENVHLKEDLAVFERLLKECPRKPSAVRHN